MSSSKEIDLAAGVYLFEVQNPIPAYSIPVHTGKWGGGVLNQSEVYRWATVHKAGSKIPT
jgi:hypothetical protein